MEKQVLEILQFDSKFKLTYFRFVIYKRNELECLG